MSRGLPRLVLLLALAACAPDPAEDNAGTATEPGTEFSAVLDAGLAATGLDALPEVEESLYDEIVDLLDLALVDDKNRDRAWRRLAELDPAARTAALLTCVEQHNFPAELRSWAYAALREFGTAAMLPRLTLRLKYEKDWIANVDLALALLTQQSGAGLAALETILATEDADPVARARAAAALAALPATEGWTPGEDFAADWRRLLDVRQVWLRERRLPGASEAAFEGQRLAECWRMLARFRSQPLRPVDDARRVFERMPAPGIDLLLATALDENRYVREHALQTLAWIGRPVARRAERAGVDLIVALAPLLADVDTRARCLEALGASGASQAEAAVRLHLEDPQYDVVTAAADALLRCGSEASLEAVRERLQAPERLSAEARFSLACLLELHGGATAEAPDGLDASERARREGWLAERRAEAQH